MKQLARLLLASLAVLACSAELPHAGAADASRVSDRYPNVSVAHLERGRAFYAERCGSCHQLRDPNSQTPDEWPGWVEKMQTEHGVHLSPSEHESILAYLVSISAR